MKERPILFSAPMVRAILEGRKTQTRRVIKNAIGEGTKENPLRMDLTKSLYGKVGDQLWVRETFGWGKFIDGHQFIEYRASPETQDTDAMDEGAPWKPSIHMPRSASRIDLLIKNVRVERLQDISDDDAIAEGIEVGEEMPDIVPGSKGRIYHDGITDPIDGWTRNPRQAFCDLWTATNGPDSWLLNPWVWVIEFERVKP